MKAQNFNEEKPMKLESPNAVKRTPTNKYPVKAFAGKEGKISDIDESTWKKPPISKNNKFVFSGLTIDVEEANKQLATGIQPLHMNRGGSPHQTIGVAILQKQKEEGKESIELLRNFYQEQIDRLSVKNEVLLRENERLKIELQLSSHHAVTVEMLKTQVAELQAKLSSQLTSSKDSPFTGIFGELRQNTKAKILSDSKLADLLRPDKLFNSSEATLKDLHNYQSTPLGQNKFKADSVKHKSGR